MPASPEEIAEAEEEGTKITCGYGPKEFLSENGHVTAVVLKKCTGLYNAEGRFAPTYDENDTITLPVRQRCFKHRPVPSSGAIC